MSIDPSIVKNIEVINETTAKHSEDFLKNRNYLALKKKIGLKKTKTLSVWLLINLYSGIPFFSVSSFSTIDMKRTVNTMR